MLLIVNYSLIIDSANAQLKFSETKFDSVTAASRFTWKVLPKGTVAIEVAPDSSDVVYIAFTGPGSRGSQRKDSVNTRRIYKGQSRFFYNLDRDSIGFKGSGKVYYWIDRGEGAPGTLVQAQGAASAFNPAADNNFTVAQTFNDGIVVGDISYPNAMNISSSSDMVLSTGSVSMRYFDDEGSWRQTFTSPVQIDVEGGEYSYSISASNLFFSSQGNMVFNLQGSADYVFEGMPVSTGGTTPSSVDGYIEIVLSGGQRIRIPYIEVHFF